MLNVVTILEEAGKAGDLIKQLCEVFTYRDRTHLLSFFFAIGIVDKPGLS